MGKKYTQCLYFANCSTITTKCVISQPIVVLFPNSFYYYLNQLSRRKEEEEKNYYEKGWKRQ